jgi:hypothetical protein
MTLLGFIGSVSFAQSGAFSMVADECQALQGSVAIFYPDAQRNFMLKLDPGGKIDIASRIGLDPKALSAPSPSIHWRGHMLACGANAPDGGEICAFRLNFESGMLEASSKKLMGAKDQKIVQCVLQFMEAFAAESVKVRAPKKAKS